MFESEFLVDTQQSKQSYEELMAQVTACITSSLPHEAFNGRGPAALGDLLSGDVLPQTSAGEQAVLEIVKTVVANSLMLTNPHTAAHLHAPALLSSLAAEVVISALNQSMDSFDQGPLATVLEQKVMRWLASAAGLPETAGGTFTTGGTQSNYLGLLLARDAFLKSRLNWPAQKSGLPDEARRMRVLCSDVAHFTVEKSASQLGLGSDAAVRVAVDTQFRMSVESLRTSLAVLKKENLLPFAIVATAGTTDFGSIDPLQEVASIAQSTGLWLHVDAAYGGALLFSPAHRNRLAGLELADSFGIDFHKLLWQVIPCSAFLLRDQRHFELMKLHADYLNPEKHEEQGIPDLVTRSLLTSRRFDALKVWISCQSLGRNKIAAMIDRTIALGAHAAGVIRSNPRFELLCEPALSTVVFRYLPSSNEVNADEVNAQIRQRLFDGGLAVIGHTRVRGHQCLKFTLMNPTVSERQIEDLVRLVAEQGKRLEREWLVK